MLKQKTNKNEKGMFLISSYLVLSVIGTFSLALFLRSATVYLTVERTGNRIKAFHLAEAGVDQAIVQLRNNSSYTGQGYTILDLGQGEGYDITVETPDPINNPTVRRISANGFSPNNVATSRAYEARQVVAYVDLSLGSPFSYSLFGDDEVDVKGTALTDSYDSRNGAYDPSTAGSNGDVGTNATGNNSIVIQGVSQVRGDAVVGPGADVNQAIQVSAGSTLTGAKISAPAATSLPAVVVPSGLTNSGALVVSGNDTVTKDGGVYRFSSINVGGNGSINFTGAATIYVEGDVKIGGSGISSASNLPTNLTIYVKGSQAVKLEGSSTFQGAIYAPGSTVKIKGNAQVYGAMVGNEVDLEGNGSLHFDEALKKIKAPLAAGKGKLLAWTEN